MKYSLFPIWLIFFILAACTTSPKRPLSSVNNTLNLPLKKIREGDLVFRRGIGVASQIILIAGKGGAYSHIGIVAKNDKNKWCIVHAVPGEPDYKDDPDRVKMESIELFFSPNHSVSGAIMRVICLDSIAQQAAIHAAKHYCLHTPFDHKYQLNDTTAFYCTELIAWAYQRVNIDLTEGRIHSVEIPGFSGDYIFPSDIQQSNKLTLLYAY